MDKETSYAMRKIVQSREFLSLPVSARVKVFLRIADGLIRKPKELRQQIKELKAT